MNVWIVFAAIASMAITALLTWWLYRLNASMENRSDSGAGSAPVPTGDGDGDGVGGEQ